MTRPGGREGLFASLGNLLSTLLAMGQARLDLLANELETQKIRALRMLGFGIGMLFCTGVAVLLVIALVTLLLWEQRIAVVSVFAALFVIAAALLYRALMRMVVDPEPPFAATMAELQEDLQRLKAMSGHAKSSD